MARLPRRLLTALCLLGLAQAAAAEPASREAMVRIAFVYNIAKFVDWPPSAFANAAAPVVFCVAGEDAFAAAEASLADKPIRERPLRLVDLGRSPDERCQVAYFAATASALAAEKQAARGALTICDPDGAGPPACMVQLQVIDSRLRFAIDLRAATRVNLKISSKLLALASAVINP